MPDKHTLQVWGGYECSVVRLESAYRNQSDETNHTERLDDIDRAHALGIRTLRCPALWETISPDDPERCNWHWHDRRFERLRQLGMRPIVGLAHHGSGPRYTNLLDVAFPELLAQHAEKVARRYPWVEDWTPVNEPLTTARFSALYGHWYPHRSDIDSFLRATVTQCAATVLAMRAVRAVVPTARLIQTEDIGKTFSTPDLAGQARFENERRWLTLDLLCGRIDRDHPWWTILSRHGISEAELELFLAADAAPDIIGVNHYLTSERYLDAEWRRYPIEFKGGNGVKDYADVEAVRVALPEEDLGPKARLREVIDRYGRPVAVTEVHHGCTREEQLRWLAEVWNAATALRAEGADVRAVTVWSLAGAVDWNSLLVARHGAYEPGAFDVREPMPRRTALGKAVAALTTTGSFTHPALGPGWWHRPERFYASSSQLPTSQSDHTVRPLLIAGSHSGLAQGFAGICDIRGLIQIVMHPARTPSEWDKLLDTHHPWAVVDLAGLGATAGAPDAEVLAAASARHGLPLLTFSSALVFDGRLERAYVESDIPCPTSEDGVVAVEVERAFLALNANALIVRVGPIFGGPAWGQGPMLLDAMTPLDPESLVSPSFLPDLAHAALDLLIDGERGLWHLANTGPAPWIEIVARLAKAAGMPGFETHSSMAGSARRTLALASERGWVMPPLEQAIAHFAHDMKPRQAALHRMAAE